MTKVSKERMELRVIYSRETDLIFSDNIPLYADWLEKKLAEKQNDSNFEKAIKHVQETYSDIHLNMPYMLLGDVADLIKITTGREVDLSVLEKYSKK